ncbi:MAG: LysR family transcriptional regulator [Brasilonema angustatum HA4187-MV1]|jgi:DNA-binding transcriptional LysR family regulator|nr:LysR family transcriptional regulator [Brasilonema angustatum HA4187-MV1]
MHEIDLSQLDLNLLLVLYALLQERNVTNAGKKIGLSQSATSHALQRLRQVFNDPLLVRSKKDMLLTPCGLSLLEPLEKILLNIEQLIQPTVFEPKTALGTIGLAVSDYATVLILPMVLKEISQQAPQLNIECHIWRGETLDNLRNGAINLGLGVPKLPETEEFKSQKLFVEDFVCIVRADHPITQTDLTVESYLALPHGSVTPINVIPIKGHLDNVFSNLGVKRRVMLKTPHFLSVPMIAEQTDLIFTLPRRIAMQFAQYTNVAILEPPIELGQYDYLMIWHQRYHEDPLHIWLRSLIVSQTQDFETKSKNY